MKHKLCKDCKHFYRDVTDRGEPVELCRRGKIDLVNGGYRPYEVYRLRDPDYVGRGIRPLTVSEEEERRIEFFDLLPCGVEGRHFEAIEAPSKQET